MKPRKMITSSIRQNAQILYYKDSQFFMQYCIVPIDIYINLCYNASIGRVDTRAPTGANAVDGFPVHVGARAWYLDNLIFIAL